MKYIAILGVAVAIIVSWYYTPATSEYSLSNLTHIKKAEEPKTVSEPTKAKKTVRTAVNKPQGDCSLVNNYAWDKRIAYAVCRAESNNNALAVNWRDSHRTCTGSFGLMQIACLHAPTYGVTTDQLKDPKVNMRIAYQVYQSSGWNAWGAFTNGSYTKYL